MTTPPLPTLHKAAATVAAYDAAVRLGILDRIDREPATIDQIAVGCGTSERGTRLLIAALSATGLVEPVSDDRYRPAWAGLAGLHPVLDLWRHLADAVRAGAPLVRANTATGGGQLYPMVVAHLARAGAAAAARAAELLPPAIDILDIGAGAAPWSLAFAARHPRCRITALDLPAVIPITRQAVEQAGRTGQYHYLPADVFDVELPHQSYDLVLVGNVCHLFPDDVNRLLLGRLASCLRPTGTLAVLDVIPHEAGSSRVALYELDLFLRTDTGRAHPLHAYQRWLAELGLVTADPIDVSDEPPITLVTGSPRLRPPT